MNHERAARYLSEYIDGALSSRRHARVEAHVVGCDSCRRELGELRRTSELLRGLRGSENAPDLTHAVMARIGAGEADASGWDRLRAGVGRFLSGSLGAPLATAVVGLALLAVLPRIEVEVSVPGGPQADASLAGVAPRPERSAQRGARLSELARRVHESPAGAPRHRSQPLPLACLEASSVEVCREHHAYMTELALDDVWNFMERVEQVPEARREDWLVELSRFAAQRGAARDVADRLRSTGDPRAQRIAARFERAR